MRAELAGASAWNSAGALHYEGGELHCESVPLSRVAKQLGTPTYIYSRSILLDKVQAYTKAARDVEGSCLVCYAVKANGNPTLLRLLAGSGLGADVVSGGELYLSLIAGFDAENIVFSGVGKTQAEIKEAISAGILGLHVESADELESVAAIAQETGRPAPIAVRVNPDIQVETHSHVATGERTHKFGVAPVTALAMMRSAADSAWLQPVGLSAHIGSQIRSLEPFRQTAEKLGQMADQLSAEGMRLEYIDVGGGLGIEYEESTVPGIDEWMQAVSGPIVQRGYALVAEPGRSIVGSAGFLLTRVLYTKYQGGRHLAITDAGMNDLLRPALYGANHPVIQFRRTASAEKSPSIVFDIVGPVCESSDVLASQRPLPGLRAGDLLAILQAGAYGYSMSSNYNGRGRPAEALVEASHFRSIRERERYSDLLRGCSVG